ncbi:MAG: ribonuclease P protein component [Chloroflexi bacterium HGW-Chloroflexi-6]|nr:MAG: ribonuclease P protein component [Chloroflexi bacterium HGW-Chloroflexi-6]
MQRRFRLTRSIDFKRVRNYGKSFAHPLLVLIALASEEEILRVGVAASRSLGGAVQRNRAKRLLREASRLEIPSLQTGRDLVFIARQPLLQADFSDIQKAIKGLLRRASLYKPVENE